MWVCRNVSDWGIRLDRSIMGTQLQMEANVEREPRPGKRVREYVPPVLSVEQADAMYRLKPFLKAIGDVNRLAILRKLVRQDGLSVLDLSDRLVLSQPLT